MQTNWEFILNNLNKSENQPMKPNDNVLLVDSMNTFFRCFAAVNFTNADQTHVGGLVGYLRSVAYIIRMIKPTKIILVFDGEGSSTNKKYLYPEYKSNRDIQKIKNWNYDNHEDETEAIINQMSRLVDYLKLLPVHILSIPKIEADDVIGHLCQKIEGKTTIMSADRDFLQLVNDRVTVYSPTKKIFYTPKKVFEEYQIYPQNFALYKTFMGDKGDNIPKIKGFGESKLYKLLPSIKGESKLTLKESLDKIDPNDVWGNKIINYKNQLEINHKLIDLSDPNISDSDKEIIEHTLKSEPFEYNPNEFEKLYHEDKLGEVMPNLRSWLESSFNYITTIK